MYNFFYIIAIIFFTLLSLIFFLVNKKLKKKLYIEKEKILFFEKNKRESLITFASGIAHELGNKVTPIKGLAMLNLEDKNLSESLAEDLTFIYESANEIEDLVSSLRLISMKSNEKNFQKINFSDIFDYINKVNIELISVKNIFEASSTLVECDFELITLAFSKIINFVQIFILENTNIAINLENNKNNINIEFFFESKTLVKNNLKYFFDPYFPLSNESNKYKNFDLAIARGIIEYHSGKILLSYFNNKFKFLVSLNKTK